ncbi:uncharacterized protein SCODWIG_03751 [Saccharomycodes ludwigii]|uniref:Zn(2)-C6 fungal-type domain-containing protein n=1 Tax=Saccharomycodes ludwigii TaxID=36035 RepID=A0A376BCY6_9ASCO|nr:uncharacterized protein SCODWIG_03751 [Saccharomycodes ludwigii]
MEHNNISANNNTVSNITKRKNIIYRKRQTKRTKQLLEKNSNIEIVKNLEIRSKLGCLTCKDRKKKCDELHPKCYNCKKNFLYCRWPKNSLDGSDDGQEDEQNGIFVNCTVDDFTDEYTIVADTSNSSIKTDDEDNNENFLFLYTKKTKPYFYHNLELTTLKYRKIFKDTARIHFNIDEIIEYDKSLAKFPSLEMLRKSDEKFQSLVKNEILKKKNNQLEFNIGNELLNFGVDDKAEDVDQYQNIFKNLLDIKVEPYKEKYRILNFLLIPNYQHLKC